MKCLKCSSINTETAVYCQKCSTYLAEKPGFEYLDHTKALVLSLMICSIFYLIFPMPVTRSQYLIQLFSGRISEIIFFLSLWSVFLIFFKFLRHLQQQKAYTAFRSHELHESLSLGIYVKDVDNRIQEISVFLETKSVKKYQNSVIFRRVRRILHYLRAVPKKEEINTILNYQAEIDHNRMQTGYMLITVLIWAIPILGFIGTVFGIGQAIGEFSDFIREVETSQLSSKMRSALSGVTQGLSVAFNTTFLALVSVIPVMVLSSSLRKGEEDLLLSIEEYCLEDLLPNLHLRPGEEAVDDAAQEHLGKLAEFSENWRRQVSPTMNELGKQSEALKQQVKGLQPLLRYYSDHVFTFKDKIQGINSLEEMPSNHSRDQTGKVHPVQEQDEASEQVKLSGADESREVKENNGKSEAKSPKEGKNISREPEQEGGL